MRRETARILAELEEALIAEGFSEEAAKELVDSFEAAIVEAEDDEPDLPSNFPPCWRRWTVLESP